MTSEVQQLQRQLKDLESEFNETVVAFSAARARNSELELELTNVKTGTQQELTTIAKESHNLKEKLSDEVVTLEQKMIEIESSSKSKMDTLEVALRKKIKAEYQVELEKMIEARSLLTPDQVAIELEQLAADHDKEVTELKAKFDQAVSVEEKSAK